MSKTLVRSDLSMSNGALRRDAEVEIEFVCCALSGVGQERWCLGAVLLEDGTQPQCLFLLQACCQMPVVFVVFGYSLSFVICCPVLTQESLLKPSYSII